MIQVVSVCNPKGGVGKSTIAIHLACCALENGREVSIVDTDSQGSAKTWAIVRPDEMKTPEVVHEKDPLALEITVERRPNELIVLDSPAGFSDMTVEVLRLSDVILVPVIPSGVDLWGVDEFDHRLAEQAGRGTEIAFVTSKYDHASTLSEGLADKISDLYPEYHHFEYGICDRVTYKRETAKGRTVLEGDDSAAKNEIRTLYHDVKRLLTR